MRKRLSEWWMRRRLMPEIRNAAAEITAEDVPWPDDEYSWRRYGVTIVRTVYQRALIDAFRELPLTELQDPLKEKAMAAVQAEFPR